uniref:Uncharacterized protein n=1 Tax=Alexandrium andersonii TaxID=327968 RepID=A0A7S2HGR2_9DINO|mmetsp:Transcript_71218/g.159418  ORF Transcript_71218/g.159418 Transcript_71218/m.159418 type:complete len:243 (+) Transcript_71218:51-779(+)
MPEVSTPPSARMPLAAADTYSLCPVFTILGVVFSGLMVLYPFYLLYVLGEAHKEVVAPFHCETSYGVWRIIHVSHLLLWSALLTLGVFCYPRRLERDAEYGEYLYMLMGFTITVPFDRILDARPSLFGYVRLSTSSLPFPLFFRPCVGADVFLKDHSLLMESLEGRKPGGYGATLAAEAAQTVAVAASVAATAIAAGDSASGGVAAAVAVVAPVVATAASVRLAASDGSSGGTGETVAAAQG